MSELPGGTVTFVFTDIEGSTRLLNSLGPSYEDALATHRRLLRAAFSSHAGVEVDTQGDAFLYAFTRAHDALAGALEAQQALAAHPWPENAELRVRMGIHTGEPTVTAEGYVGADVHTGARICAVAWGEQILVSDATARLLADNKEASLRDLGEHSLKDIDTPVRLHQVIAPDLREDFPPPRTASSHPTNLPPTLDSLVGRAEDTSELTSLLASPEVRIVTLTGPGGVGKTRLALAAGAELLPSFPDGVFFVDLSALSDPALVTGAIAAALGVRESAGRSLSETLADYLASRHTLLVLDNLEHLLDAAADVSGLVTSAPSLKVLVTSREPLHISGEHEVPLAPLALPPENADASEVAAAPAVELFVARARALRPSFELTADDASSVSQICRRLDGLPLAIELAAARTKVLSLPALASRLEQSLAALGHGHRDASARQKTLRGAISWSYGLLTPDEQTLFRRLGVFAGGFTLEAAEAVCDRDDLSTDVLDGLASLVDKSLVRAREHEDRFTMLETIRSFASDELEVSGEAEDIRRAHADYFQALAEEAERHTVQGPQQMAWLQRLEREHDNMRAALDSLSEFRQRQPELGMALALRHFWRFHGHLGEGRRRLESTLEGGGAADQVLKARALAAVGLIAHLQGDYHSARVRLEEALDIEKRHNLTERVAGTLNDLGLVLQAEGDYEGARNLYEETIRIAGDLDDTFLVTLGTHNLADLALIQENFKEAALLSTRTLRLWRELGDAEGIAMALANGAFAALNRGRFDEAKDLLSEGLLVAKELGSVKILAGCIGGFAAVAALCGQPPTAARLSGAAKKLRESIGATTEEFEARQEQRTVSLATAKLGEAKFQKAFEEGRASTAEGAIAQALRVGGE